MLSLNNIKSTTWSRKTSKKVWRGNGSGKWTFCWRGCNWQNSRSWGGVPSWFEWGQTPLFRRMPKLKGFSNDLFKKEYNVINISDLEVLASKWITEINREVLISNRIIRKKSLPIKLLWSWEIKSKFTVFVNKVSVSAKEAIEKAWWKLELINK